MVKKVDRALETEKIFKYSFYEIATLKASLSESNSFLQMFLYLYPYSF